MMVLSYVPVVSKEAYLAAVIHDVVCIPFSPARSVPHVLYPSGLGRLLYAAYVIEKGGLWRELFLCVVGVPGLHCGAVDSVLSELRRHEVYCWDSVEGDLLRLSEGVGSLYNEKKELLISVLRKVYGFRKLFERTYVIYGFNPVPGLSFGSLLHYDNENVVLAVYVNALMNEGQVLDVIIHELLHGLIKLNGLRLEHDLEELIIDASAPQGYLSELLGLVDRSRARVKDVIYFARKGAEKYEQVFQHIRRYFEERRYDEVSIFEWVSKRRSNGKGPATP